MAVVSVLQLGNAMAGDGVPSLFLGESLQIRLTVFDDVSQQAVAADATYTQVLCSCTLAAGTYQPGQLVAQVSGQPSQVFTNLNQVVSTGGVVTGVVFQSKIIGPVPATVAPATLTVVAPGNPAGFTAITNPAGQSQSGAYSVAGTLISPIGNATALVISSPAIGVYQATEQLVLEGSYAVQLTGTAGNGSFTIVAQGAANCGVDT